MNKLARIANIVDDFIYGKIPITQAHNAYDTIIKPAYTQLSYRPRDIDFYNGKQLRGYIQGNGEVGFTRRYPELNDIGLGESYRSPEEILSSGTKLTSEQREILQNYPQPTRELIKLGKSFQDYSNSPDGSRLYSNHPISDHRAKAYRKWGFDSLVNEHGHTAQYLDKRPYADNELINKVYVIGDTFVNGIDTAQLTLNQRISNNKLQGSRIANINQKLLDIDDYIGNTSSVPIFRRESYRNPYLPQQESVLTRESSVGEYSPTRLSPQQQESASRFARMRAQSRQGNSQPNPQSTIQRYIDPEYRGSIEISQDTDGAYDLFYGSNYRSLDSEQFNELHNALLNNNMYQYAFNPF